MSTYVRYTLPWLQWYLKNLTTLELGCSCKNFGMKINAAKCKVLSPFGDPVTIDSNPVGHVENFVFLGSYVPNSSNEIKRRIAMASFEKLNKLIWKRPWAIKWLKTKAL